MKQQSARRRQGARASKQLQKSKQCLSRLTPLLPAQQPHKCQRHQMTQTCKHAWVVAMAVRDSAGDPQATASLSLATTLLPAFTVCTWHAMLSACETRQAMRTACGCTWTTCTRWTWRAWACGSCRCVGASAAPRAASRSACRRAWAATCAARRRARRRRGRPSLTRSPPMTSASSTRHTRRRCRAEQCACLSQGCSKARHHLRMRGAPPHGRGCPIADDCVSTIAGANGRCAEPHEKGMCSARGSCSLKDRGGFGKEGVKLAGAARGEGARPSGWSSTPTATVCSTVLGRDATGQCQRLQQHAAAPVGGSTSAAGWLVRSFCPWTTNCWGWRALPTVLRQRR